MPSPAAVDLTDAVRAFLAQPFIAMIASLDEDGAPRQAAVWFRLDDDGRILLNSRAGRRWCDNLERDGRMSIAVIDPAAIAQGQPGNLLEQFRLRSREAEAKGLAEPFTGITATGRVEPGLFAVRSTGVSTEPVRAAASAWSAS